MRNCGALFDLDGVIIDSEGRYTEFWQEIDEIYPTGIPDYAVAIKGTTLPVILNNYKSQEVRDDITKRLMNFQAQMKFEPYPGAIEFLEQLRRRDVPLALVTSSDDRKMERLFTVIPELKELMSVVIDGSMVSRSKPDPEGYLRAAREIGRKSEECFVFEDSLQGLAAARASGAVVVGIATTYPSHYIEQRADIVVPALGDIDIDKLLAADFSRP
ncbi:MAG: HAD family phosphatase [Paramuribaculum sp.]|nr:HAD family phosphatase [Paramuribaculum sp.]